MSKNSAYPYTMRECIVDYLTAMGARTYSQIQNECRPQCSDYDRNALPPLLAQMATEGTIGMDSRRFAVCTLDLINAETREAALFEQHQRDAVAHAQRLFDPIPSNPLDAGDVTE